MKSETGIKKSEVQPTEDSSVSDSRSFKSEKKEVSKVNLGINWSEV